jgi:capsular polysaccharide biosynthesis protein
MMNLSPVWHKMLSLRGAMDFREAAIRQQVLCPAEMADAPPAICLEGDIENVIAFQQDTNREQEMTRLHGGKRLHEATIAYTLADVDFLPSGLYKGRMRYMVRPVRDPIFRLPPRELLQDAALCCTLYGSIYFGHWMTDDLTLQLAAEPFGLPVIAARNSYGHEEGYRELFQLHNHKQITHAHCSRITVFMDRGQNSYKRQRYATLRSRLRKNAATCGNKRVFIRRGGSGEKREILNADALEQYLLSQGFVIVSPEALTPGQIAGFAGGARVVLGVEGSHLIHGIFAMDEGGVLCTLQPPTRFNNVVKDNTDCLGFKYAFMVCEPAEGGFTVNLDHLKDLLERLDVLAG